jgi:hypothetical protein
MRTSLRRKILSWTLLPAMVIFLIVSVVSFFATQSIAESLVTDRDQELARLTAAELSASLEEYPLLLSGIARDLTTATVSGPDVQANLEDNANRLAYFDGGAVLLNNLGRSSPPTPCNRNCSIATGQRAPTSAPSSKTPAATSSPTSLPTAGMARRFWPSPCRSSTAAMSCAARWSASSAWGRRR